MVFLHNLSDFIDCNFVCNSSSPTYYYEGRCPEDGEVLLLPRNALVEAIAYSLMRELGKNDLLTKFTGGILPPADFALYSREGKMYGVLLVELSTGEQRILKAFSGLLHGKSVVEGWIPPIPGRVSIQLISPASGNQELANNPSTPTGFHSINIPSEWESAHLN